MSLSFASQLLREPKTFLMKRALLRRIRALVPAIEGRVLDVGSGKSPYLPFFRATRYVSMEAASKRRPRSSRCP